MHSTSIPGDIILSKRPEGIQKHYQNEFLSMDQTGKERAEEEKWLKGEVGEDRREANTS